jgi:PTH2 family peptidyl-tRNA hydrolase
MPTNATDNTSMWLVACAAAFVAGVLAMKLYTPTNITVMKATALEEKKKPDPILDEDLSSVEESEDEESDSEDEESDEDEERYKMILAVRTDLKMTSGKVAAQCGHATLGAYRDIIRKYKRRPSELTTSHLEWLRTWDVIGCAKIAVQVPSIDLMEDLYKKAKEAGLPVHFVIDAGKTQIASGSKTVLAIGPAPESKINPVTRQLKLL